VFTCNVQTGHVPEMTSYGEPEGIIMATRDGEPEVKSPRQPEVQMEKRIFNEMTSIFTSGNVCLDPSGQRRPMTKSSKSSW